MFKLKSKYMRALTQKKTTKLTFKNFYSSKKTTFKITLKKF